MEELKEYLKNNDGLFSRDNKIREIMNLFNKEKMEWLKSIAPDEKYGSDSYLYGRNDYRKDLFTNAEKSLKEK